MASSFPRFYRRPIPARALAPTEEALVWQSFKAFTHFPISISKLLLIRTPPYNVAVAWDGEVVLCKEGTHEVLQKERFKGRVHCVRFRADGKMLVAGGEQRKIRAWATGDVKLVREMSGHTRAVCGVDFFCDKTRVFSCSDDQSCRVWDMMSGEEEAVLLGHSDYVRAACTHPFRSELAASAGYDHTVRMWDVRAGRDVLCVQHRSPVETAVFHPKGGLLVSGGGGFVAVWDIVAGRSVPCEEGGERTGGNPAACACHHAKGVTSLAFTSSGSRLLSGGMDECMHVYDCTACELLHTMSFPGAIMSTSISGDDMELVVGLIDGRALFRRRSEKKRERDEDAAAGAESDGAKFETVQLYSGLGRDIKRGRGRGWWEPVPSRPAEGDRVIERGRKIRLKPTEVALKNFQYGVALDRALASGQIGTFVSMVEELLRRNGLKIALTGKDDQALVSYLKVVGRGVTIPDYCRTLCLFVDAVLDVHFPVLARHPEVSAVLSAIFEKVQQQAALMEKLEQVRGMARLLGCDKSFRSCEPEFS